MQILQTEKPMHSNKTETHKAQDLKGIMKTENSIKNQKKGKRSL